MRCAHPLKKVEFAGLSSLSIFAALILKRLKTYLIFIAILISNGILGQSDSAKTNTKQKIRPYFTDLQSFENLKRTRRSYDTSLDGIHRLNPYLKASLPYQDLGLVGTPIQPLFLKTIKDPGFDPGFNRLKDWMVHQSDSDIQLVTAPTPYTFLNYCQGAKDLIFLDVLHTRNITPRFNAGLKYRRIKTNNYLFYQMGGDLYNKIRIPSIYNLDLFGSYRSKTDKYYVLGNLVLNKINVRESGGLTYPLSFDSTKGNLRVFENPLNDASNSLKQHAAGFRQYYRFGTTTYQTVIKDSVPDTLSFDFRPNGYFFHNLLVRRTLFQYLDPQADTPYYPFPAFGNNTNDSIALKEINNDAGIFINVGKRNINQQVKLAVSHSQYWYHNAHNSQDVFHNLSLYGALHTALNSRPGFVHLNANGRLYVSGYNSKDYLSSIQATLAIRKKFILEGNLLSQRHTPDYFQTKANTNFAIWDQNLNPVYRNGLNAKMDIIPLGLKAGINVSNFRNYVLYYRNSAPSGVDFSYLEWFVSNHIQFGACTWHNRISNQTVSKTFHLPEWTLAGGLFWEHKFFKKNMQARFGLDYYWYSSYYADRYIPWLRQFVWQNDVKIGNYPYIDLYISATVQTMNLFVKFEHLNQGISGNRYYASPEYPNPPRFFRFGLNWRLFH